MAGSGNDANSEFLPGSDLLGVLYTTNDAYTANWMSQIPDDTPLEHINIPGTHDACAWNYKGLHNEMYNCQDTPLLQQLDAGIRLLDLRFGWSPLHDRLFFYHGSALLSDNTTVQDVLSGFARWLAVHPTETLLLSMKVDHGPTDKALQRTMYDLITSSKGPLMFSQLSGELGTLGQVRGKAVLLQRFDWTDISSSNAAVSLPGINVSPTYWTDNSPSFSISFAPNHVASIEDYYKISDDDGLVGTVDAKLNATISHIELAAADYQTAPDSAQTLWISFASAAGYNSSTETIFPRPTAIGDGVLDGVNQKLYEWLNTLHSQGPKRVGVILLDFFATVDDLVPLILRLNKPLYKL